jgi:hypothetical protein
MFQSLDLSLSLGGEEKWGFFSVGSPMIRDQNFITHPPE